MRQFSRSRHFSRTTLLSAMIISSAGFSSMSLAAGYEFSRFNYSNLYNKHNNATLSYSLFRYDIDGQGLDGSQSGNLIDDLHYWQGSVNYHLDDQWSVNAQYYRAYNVNTYHNAGVYEGSGAFLQTRTLALTALYRLDNNVSFFAGPTISKTRTTINFDSALTGYQGNIQSYFGDDYAYGYTLGASYQQPEIGLRATLGYQSSLKFNFNTIETGSLTSALTGSELPLKGQSSLVLPHKVTFDFQTGIAPKTLLTLNMHWSNWSDNTLDSAATQMIYGKPFVTFAHNTFDYTAGVAYQFTPKYAMFMQGVYSEGAGEDGVVNALAPANGAKGLKLGARYNLDDMSVFLVTQNMWLKDGQAPQAAGGALFEDNSVFNMSAGVEYRF